MKMNIRADKLRMERYKKGLSIQSLAETVGMSYTRIMQIENGTAKNVRADNIYKICKALDIEVEDVISFV